MTRALILGYQVNLGYDLRTGGATYGTAGVAATLQGRSAELTPNLLPSHFEGTVE